jgi:tetrahydromethanopterin S-methyltransferase subunit F
MHLSGIAAAAIVGLSAGVIAAIVIAVVVVLAVAAGAYSESASPFFR